MGKSQQDLPLEELHFLFKVDNRNAKKMCEILSITSLTGNYNKLTSKLIMKKSKWRRWRRSGIFIDNFEHISHLFSSVSTVEFEHVNVCWVLDLKIKITNSKSLIKTYNMQDNFPFFIKHTPYLQSSTYYQTVKPKILHIAWCNKTSSLVHPMKRQC